MVNILFIGDIVGKPGRAALSRVLTGLIEEHSVQLCVGNAENAAGGFGLTPETANDLFKLGIHVLTSGNHIFDKREIIKHLDVDSRILRPANYPTETPGMGSYLFRTDGGMTIGVLNLMGRVFIDSIDCPFKRADEEIERLRENTNIIFVDMHAEATSEKVAMGYHLDGRVSCVFGTHTHIVTADEKIMPKGTAYITDIGMTGSYDSVLGRNTQAVLKNFRTQQPCPFGIATGDVRLSGIIVTVDSNTKKAEKIERIQIFDETADAQAYDSDEGRAETLNGF